MSDPTKKRIRAFTMWRDSSGGRRDGDRFVSPWFKTNQELLDWLGSHPAFWGGHKIKIEEGSAIRKSRPNLRHKLRLGPGTPLDKFLKAYIETALWSSVDEDGQSFEVFNESDLDGRLFEEMFRDAESFLEDNAEDIGMKFGRAGHDFWLTRNRHGAGFWDGDWEGAGGSPSSSRGPAKRLTEAAHAYGSQDLYLGDDGKIHGS